MDLGWVGVDLGWIWGGFGVDLGWIWGGFGGGGGGGGGVVGVDLGCVVVGEGGGLHRFGIAKCCWKLLNGFEGC